MPAQTGECGQCEKCGTEIIFLRHARTGKLAPIEVKPDPQGRFQINWQDQTYTTIFTPKVSRQDYYENHYVRCPAAQFFRNRSSQR